MLEVFPPIAEGRIKPWPRVVVRVSRPTFNFAEYRAAKTQGAAHLLTNYRVAATCAPQPHVDNNDYNDDAN